MGVMILNFVVIASNLSHQLKCNNTPYIFSIFFGQLVCVYIYMFLGPHKMYGLFVFNYSLFPSIFDSFRKKKLMHKNLGFSIGKLKKKIKFALENQNKNSRKTRVIWTLHPKLFSQKKKKIQRETILINVLYLLRLSFMDLILMLPPTIWMR